ncbi:hypothetical protein DPMN_014033 [Dreissena polymorpha]|uniref:Uncharacterized protein n=1 Tax=Dreissena polymorpha TaxID=45954 RepID=A0A9D4S334_DREPO|nr:hypothetical protein DPMN_014033 [Dreissena polymorpha]
MLLFFYFRYITDLEQVDDSIRESLQKLMDTGKSITKALGYRVIQEKLTQQIWDTEFNAIDTESLDAYILNRLKNERRGLKNQALLDTQNKMLNDYLAMGGTANDESEDIVS